MLLLPAIDLRDGRCVRLRQGDYAQETIYGDDPLVVAQRWVAEGALYLHLVDLDGARAGEPINVTAIRAMAQHAGVPCQLGGGLRTTQHVAQAFDLGVQRVILGTQALAQPKWFAEMAQSFPRKVLLGLDARNGSVATHGWEQDSGCRAVDLALRLADLPLAGLVYTDVHRDGMLQGPNVTALTEMTQAQPLPVIASGGVTTIEDVRRLSRLPLAGCIIGRALYEGTLHLGEALAAATAPAVAAPRTSPHGR